MNLTSRQKNYLKLIIEDFITNGEPIGSNNFIKKNNLDISPATVRSEMNFLETAGLLEKKNFSSGRIPSSSGYRYYVDHLITLKSNSNLKRKLNEVFAKRTLNLNIIIDEVVDYISQITGFTLITSSERSGELLKAIQLIPLDENKVTIIMVTSSGHIESKIMVTNNQVDLKDLKIAVRLFQERLIDTPLGDLQTKVMMLKTLLGEKILNFEFLLQEFVTKIFNFHIWNEAHIHGEKNIIQKKDISKEQLLKIISLLEKKSIWDSIEKQSKDDHALKILIDQDNTSILSKKINIGDSSREISIVGTHRIEYAKAIMILKILENFLVGKDLKKN